MPHCHCVLCLGHVELSQLYFGRLQQNLRVYCIYGIAYYMQGIHVVYAIYYTVNTVSLPSVFLPGWCVDPLSLYELCLLCHLHSFLKRQVTFHL